MKKVFLTSAPTKEPVVTPAFVFAWLVNFAQFMIFYVLVTTMAGYAVKEFAANNASAGLASSAFVIGATGARVFSGFLVDAVGRRRVLFTALVLIIVTCAFYIPAHSLGLLITVRIIHGIGYAFASTAVMAVAQSVIPSSRRAEGTGYFALGTTLATAIGPALGLWLVGSVGYTTMFQVVIGMSIVAFLLSLLVRSPEAHGHSEHAHPHRPTFNLSAIVHPKVAPIGFFMLLVGICYAGVITYLNGYSEDNNLVTGAEYFFLAYALVTLVMRFVLGKIQDQKGDNIVIYLGLVTFAIALVVLAFSTQDWMVILAGALTGLGYGSLMPAAQAISVKAVEPHQMGAGISTLFLLLDVGVGFGPILLGMIVSATSYQAMYTMLAGLVVISAAVYFLVHGRKVS
ncbi:MFS transporter [Corynebacterium macclintockiae]|uniref:MFS transporter n=1 Tax=Corynebacterium macclintockiae TaxID=2913501 RepID=UPI003EB981D4